MNAIGSQKAFRDQDVLKRPIRDGSVSEDHLQDTLAAIGRESTPWGSQHGLDTVSVNSSGWCARDDYLELMLFGRRLADIQTLIDREMEPIAVIGMDFQVLATNEYWRDAVDLEHFHALSPGSDYRDYLAERSSVSIDAALTLAGVTSLAAGKITHFTHVYSGTSPPLACSHRSCLRSGGNPEERLILVTCHHLGNAESDGASDLSVLLAQQEERKRLGRELHDSTSQLVVGLQLSLLQLKLGAPPPAFSRLAAEMEDMLRELHRELRAVSYSLHPPPLMRRKLAQSLRAMIRGFGSRTGLEIQFHVEGRPRLISPAAEATLYRLAQEALVNVYRHAKARHIDVRLVARPGGYLHLVVRDDGIGFPRGAAAARSGVGIPGMRSRLEELGGKLTIRHLQPGTAIIASLSGQSRALNGPEDHGEPMPDLVF